MWCAKGSLTKAVDESPERLILFLSDAKKGDGCSLMWAAAGEVSGENVGEGVKAVDGVWRKGSKPFEGGAFKGGREGLAENGIVRSVEVDMGDIDLEVFICIGLTQWRHFIQYVGGAKILVKLLFDPFFCLKISYWSYSVF